MVSRLVRLQGWETPLVLLGVVLLSYGLWIPWFGLFGNDVPYLWYYHLFGPWGPGEFASIDRPASALFYAASTFALGETVWPYHVFLLLLRWLSAVLLWWVLGLVWPERKREAVLAALLFAVYPGFRQNPVSLEFILHFFVLNLFLLSLWTMLLAVCHLRPGRAPVSRKAGLLILASASAAAGPFFLEYFIGLEILRPIFLWIVTRRAGLTGKEQWKRILIPWVPALVVVALFVVWRVFIFSFPTYKPVLLEHLRESPLPALLDLARTAARDVWTSLGAAWVQTLRLPEGRRSLIVYAALAAASLGLVGFLWQRSKRWPVVPTSRGYWGESVLGIGLVAMLAGGSIFWVTGIPVTLVFPWDRSTLSFMLGASLAAAGLVEMAVTPRYRPVLAAGLVALAVGMHFLNAQEYRAEWQKLQDFYWQLTWRAPQLEPGTLALFDVIPLNRYSDNDMTALLNWTYAPDLHDHQIPYKFFDLTIRLDSPHTGLPGLEKDLPVEHNQRGVNFKTTTSHTLAVHYNPPACLKVLGPEDGVLPGLPERLARALPITRLEQIRADGEPARPPAQLGEEPPHGWCYYYQKAELARQQQDWSAAAGLGDQAFEAGLNPQDPAELLPFIEGYAVSGNLDRARALSQEAAKQPDLLPALCALWDRAAQANPELVNVLGELGCQP